MAITSNVVCDECGRIKGVTNHWIVAVVCLDKSGVMFIPADDAVDPRDVDSAKYSDICGQECASKYFSRWLETLTR